MGHETVQRRQKRALRSAASRRLRRGLAGCGGRIPCPAQLLWQPRPLGQLRNPSAGQPSTPGHSRASPYPKTEHNPRSHQNKRLFNEIEQLHFSPPHTHTDIPPFGRTRSLKSSGTASCCFQTRAETDKEIVKEKFGVASYKTESSKNPRTFGSISCLVNRTHLYSCVF